MIIDKPVFTEHIQKECSLFIRVFGDLFDPVSGNKPFKLKYFVEDANPSQTLLSFGGAWSNHLLALSALAFRKGHPSIGVIRGEKPLEPNPLMLKMLEFGMKFHFVSRTAYRDKTRDEFIDRLLELYPQACIIPEGGAGNQGIRGAMEMVSENEEYDFIILPVATGTTLAGIAKKLAGSKVKIIGIQVLKGQNAIKKQLMESAAFDLNEYPNVCIIEDYHMGGYAKTNSALISFLNDWNSNQPCKLDQIYGAKAMLGVFDLISKNYFPLNSKILYIHTGGLGHLTSEAKW
jgi:1-aminocyclopropane-1-carboxylate deaminase/D-cysteine desulfhydrase-like pyridoxal-dependent ACC family enzyme